MNTEHSAIKENTNDDVNGNLDLPVIHINHAVAANLDQMENNYNSTDETVKTQNAAANSNLNPQRCFSIGAESTENDVVSMTKILSIKRKMKQNISSASMGVVNVLRYKVLIAFIMCCIIGCYLTPIILYYVYETRDNAEIDPESNATIANTSNAKVCCLHKQAVRTLAY